MKVQQSALILQQVSSQLFSAKVKCVYRTMRDGGSQESHLVSLCYTGTMQSDRELWPVWVHFLKRGGITELASFLLEAGGPLITLAAQFVYLGQPFLNPGSTSRHLQALAELLEDREEAISFAAFLREDTIQ